MLSTLSDENIPLFLAQQKNLNKKRYAGGMMKQQNEV